MVRKASTASKKSTNDGDKGEANTIKKTATTATTAIAPEQNVFTILVTGEASKIGQKSEGKIGYELIKDKEGILYLRLTSNSSSGNFCKTPVLLQDVIDLLQRQLADRAFNSKILSSAFQGKGSKSANNTSFLMAVLRSEEVALIRADVVRPLTSKLSPDFAERVKQLLALA